MKSVSQILKTANQVDVKDTKPQVNKKFPLLIFFRKILYLCTQNVFRCNKIEFLSTIFEYIYFITDDFQAVCLFFSTLLLE